VDRDVGSAGDDVVGNGANPDAEEGRGSGMSETKHSPEPWTDLADGIDGPANSHPVVDVDTHSLVARAYGDEVDEAEANARRIVACVNACAGIPTAALESGALAEAIRAAQDLFPWGPDHSQAMLRGDALKRLHDALRVGYAREGK
jgi:hypothetical protein